MAMYKRLAARAGHVSEHLMFHRFKYDPKRCAPYLNPLAPTKNHPITPALYFLEQHFEHLHRREPMEDGAVEKFCLCNEVENPDRLMVCCESCRPPRWFHAGALPPTSARPARPRLPQSVHC